MLESSFVISIFLGYGHRQIVSILLCCHKLLKYFKRKKHSVLVFRNSKNCGRHVRSNVGSIQPNPILNVKNSEESKSTLRDNVLVLPEERIITMNWQQGFKPPLGHIQRIRDSSQGWLRNRQP